MATEGQGPDDGRADEPGPIGAEIPEAPAPVPGSRWRLGLGLLAASVLGTAAILPYSFAVMGQAKNSGFTPGLEPVIAAVSLVVEGGLSALAIAAGIGLGRRTGLGPYLLAGVDDGPGSAGAVASGASGPSRVRAWRAIGLASAVGVVLGVVVVGASFGFARWMPKVEAQVTNPPPLVGLLASVGAGIREEVWLRLGLMTLLAWLGMAIGRLGPGQPAVIWAANVLAAVAFGAMHLPQAAMLYGLNAAIVGFVFLGNGIPGIAFGWLFWRRGLVAAMMAHFVLDVVLKAILPAFDG